MDFDLRPLEGAGPLLLGVPLATARQALESLGLSVEEIRLGDDPPRLHFQGTVSGFAHSEDDGRVLAYEFANPNYTDGAVEDRVLYNGLDLFGTPARDVIAALSAETEVDADGDDVHAVDLHLALWRGGEHYDQVDDDGRATYFTSVLLAAEGYY